MLRGIRSFFFGRGAQRVAVDDHNDNGNAPRIDDDGKRRARMRALRGDFATVDVSFAAPAPQLLVFVSSTFTDTHEERNVLLSKVLISLREEARPHGIEVILLDLRSGIPDENTLDHLTWLGCQRELMRCFSQSAGLFFLSLQGNKYGYMPIPKYIDRAALDARLLERSGAEFAADVALAREWYVLDTNAVPAVYVLKNLVADWALGDASIERQFWDKDKGVLVRLRELLHGVAFDRDFEDGIIGRSVTEYEAKLALKLCGVDGSGEKLRKGVRWLRRELTGITDLAAQDAKWELNDARDAATVSKLEELKAGMESALLLGGAGLVAGFDVSIDSFNAKDDAHRQYLAAFEGEASSMLRAALGAIVAERDAWNLDGCGLGLGGDALREMLHHATWAREKCAGFVGREALVAEALGVVIAARPPVVEVGGDDDDDDDDDDAEAGEGNDDSEHDTGHTDGGAADVALDNDCNGDAERDDVPPFAGITLAVIGRSGTGKTALMSKLANAVRSANSGRPVIIRFCGTSKGSADGLSLVRSLCAQILLVVEGAHQEVVPETYVAAVALLHKLLEAHAVVLFIDSLDQLSDKDLARSKVSFLKGVKPHPDTRIVVSALPDDKDVVAGSTTRYFYGCDSTLAASDVPRVIVANFFPSTAREIFVAILGRQQRTLTATQWDVVTAAVAVEPTALYLNLAATIARQWRSFDNAHLFHLRGGVVAVTEQIFELLERDYGALLTRAALGFITWSVRGVSDVEMEDLLSLHEEVLAKVLKYCRGVTRLPSHVWLRLRGALQGLVVEHNGGCLQWYHRQLWEAAKRRYAVERKSLQVLMGRYFGDLVDAAVVAEKQIHRQPLTYSGGVRRDAVMPDGRKVVVGGAVWTAPLSHLNERRAVEAGVHLVAAGLVKEAVDELCDLETVCLRFKVGVGTVVVQLLVDLHSMVVTGGSLCAEDHRRLEHYRRWLLRDASAMQNNVASILYTAAAQPNCSIVRRASVATAVDISLPAIPNSAAFLSTCRVLNRVLGGPEDFDALLSVCVGHKIAVLSVSFSPDGTRLASCGDTTLHLWDVATGAMVATLEGRVRGVISVDWSPDGTRLASASEFSTVRVWDVATLTSVATLQEEAWSVSWSPDGMRLASGSCIGSLHVWDVATWALLATLEGHTEHVSSVTWSPDGTRLASASTDKTVRVWDVASLTSVATLQEEAWSVSWSPNGTRLASGSTDKTVRVWDVATGAAVAVLEGHTHQVGSVRWSPDGTRLVSGSKDETVRVWDVATGAAVAVLKGHVDRVLSVCWSPDGMRLASGSRDQTVRVWDVAAGSARKSSQRHTDETTSVCWSPDGTRLASGWDGGTVRVWDMAKETAVATLKGDIYAVSSVSWSPDGTRLASGWDDGTVCVWDVVTWAVLLTLKGHTTSGTFVSWSLHNTRLAMSRDGTVDVWDAATGGTLTMSDPMVITSCVLSVSMSPDGTRLASGHEEGGDALVQVWNVAKASVVATMDGHIGEVRSVSWSPDGKALASGSQDMTVRVWNVTKRAALATTLVGHRGGVISVSWSPDGTRLASASEDTTVRVWNVAKGSVVATLEGFIGAVRSVSWSPNGKQLASASKDTTVRVWDIVEGPVAS